MPKESWSGKKPEEKTAKQKVVDHLTNSTSGSLFYVPYPGRKTAYADTNPETATEAQIKANMQDNPLLEGLTAQDLVDACLEAKDVYTLIDSLPLIENKGLVDHNKVIKGAMIVSNGTYAEYIIRNLKKGKFRSVNNETLGILASALNGKYKEEVEEYKKSLNN